MTRSEAQALALVIERETPNCYVRGYKVYDWDYYELEVADTISGYPFVIRDLEDWRRRSEP